MKRFFATLAVVLAILSPATAHAQQTSTGWLPHHDYQYFFDEGFYGTLAPIHVEVGLVYGHVHFNAVFGPMPYGFSGWATHHGMTDAAFAQRNQQYLSQGYTLVHHQRLNTDGHLANQGIWYR